MTVLKSTITSFNITMQEVDKNEKLLTVELRRLYKVIFSELNKLQYQVN